MSVSSDTAGPKTVRPTQQHHPRSALQKRLLALPAAFYPDQPVERRRLAAGEVLYHQGRRCDSIYLVESGYLKLVRQDATGNPTITALLGTGELCGNGLCGAEVTEEASLAKSMAVVRRYPAAQFFQLIEQDSGLATLALQTLAQRQAASDRRLHAVLTLDVRGRIAMVLHDLISRNGGRCAHGHEVDVPLTHQELAELTGASRPVVTATLNQLREEGLLDYCRAFICVNDQKALRLAGGCENRLSPS